MKEAKEQKEGTLMHPIQMVDLKRQYLRDQQAFDQAIADVVAGTAFIGGKTVAGFCQDLAQFLDCPHVIPCANGTDALQLALMALDLEPGDEVITVPFTFVSTVEVIALLGLKPVFVDVDPQNFNMDLDSLRAAIGPKTKAIVPVHLFGQSCQMESIMALADDHGIKVVEDNAQAIGCDFRFDDGSQRKTGTIGHIGTTSFYPTKNLGAWGDGGAITTRDENLAKRLKTLANHGSDRKYYYDSIGVNSRLDAMQAAVLGIKLQRLDQYHERRAWAAKSYDEGLKDLQGVTLPHRESYSTHVFHQYTLRIAEQRDALKDHLLAAGIPTMIYYPVPLHMSKAYQTYGYESGDFPVSEQLAKEVLSLPMHSELDHEQIDFTCIALRGFFNR